MSIYPPIPVEALALLSFRVLNCLSVSTT